MAGNIIICLIMMILSIQDILHKSLNAICVGIFMAVSLVYAIIKNEFTFVGIITGISFILILIIISSVFKCIGMGDVMAVMILLFIKGTVFTVFVFTLALFLLGIINFVRVLMKRISVKSEIPFVPYLGICVMVVSLCV